MEEEVGKGERDGCEDQMGWDLLAGSCTGGQERSDGREAMNRENEWKNVEVSLSQICGST